MNNIQKYIVQLIEKFKEQKGKGSCYCFNPVKYEQIITVFINLHRQKRQDTNILIVTKDYNQRMKIKETLEHYGLIDNVTILTKTYIKTEYKYNYTFSFLLDVDDLILINHFNTQTKFTFAIFTENVNIIEIHKVLPCIRPSITFGDLQKDRINYPVEEEHLGVNMSNDDIELSKRYDEYISQSMSIFGSFENADKCRIGDTILNISAAQFRYDLAIENGWSETLDTTIEFNNRLDAIYNPNALYERANTLYNIIRERSNLLTDNNSKLEKIIEIINNNRNKKILIVSKRGEFANIIANYINENTEFLCGEYHDCIPEQYLKDENGNYIVYKSGENKGKNKLFKSKALSTMCLERFNSSDNSQRINLLSIKNSSDTKLKTAIDIVIFTSSLCSTTPEFINRYTNIDFNTNPLKVYVIYCNDSLETNKLQNRISFKNVKLIQSQENIKIDEINGAVYL